MIHFRILDDTLCGAEYRKPSRRAAKDGRLCDECINVMWREQYRRNTLSRVSVKEQSITHEHDDSEERETGLYLIDFKNS